VSLKGNPSSFEADLHSRMLHMSKMKDANDRQVLAMEKSIGENMRDAKLKGNDNKIRAAKSRQKRMEERMGMQVSATGGRFKLSRDRAGYHDSLRDEIEVPTEEVGGSLVLPEASELRFPGLLVSLEAVGFRYKGSLPSVLLGVDLVVHMGDRIGIVGLNGSG
jgi:ATPase subunit of ABC transporter with duplicated ATPase domains